MLPPSLLGASVRKMNIAALANHFSLYFYTYLHAHDIQVSLYRVVYKHAQIPGFLATSASLEVARTFAYKVMAVDGGVRSLGVSIRLPS